MLCDMCTRNINLLPGRKTGHNTEGKSASNSRKFVSFPKRSNLATSGVYVCVSNNSLWSIYKSCSKKHLGTSYEILSGENELRRVSLANKVAQHLALPMWMSSLFGAKQTSKVPSGKAWLTLTLCVRLFLMILLSSQFYRSIRNKFVFQHSWDQFKSYTSSFCLIWKQMQWEEC